MDTEPRQSADHFGLAAYGRAGRWEVSVLESVDRDNEWLAELDGDNVYLVIRLTRVTVIPEVLSFVKSVLTNGRSTNGSGRITAPDSIEVGSFGDVPVQLAADRQEIPRCFLIAACGTGTSLRVTLTREDLELLADALEQIIRELPASALTPQLPV